MPHPTTMSPMDFPIVEQPVTVQPVATHTIILDDKDSGQLNHISVCDYCRGSECSAASAAAMITATPLSAGVITGTWLGALTGFAKTYGLSVAGGVGAGFGAGVFIGCTSLIAIPSCAIGYQVYKHRHQPGV